MAAAKDWNRGRVDAEGGAESDRWRIGVTVANVRTFVDTGQVDEKPVSGFDWDEGNRTHCQRHGVSLAEIEALLRGNPRVAPDLTHSLLEDRLIAVGRTESGRPLFVAFTMRERSGRLMIRPVSARYMHPTEIANYETQGF